jgi:hypothetical protein
LRGNRDPVIPKIRTAAKQLVSPPFRTPRHRLADGCPRLGGSEEGAIHVDEPPICDFRASDIAVTKTVTAVCLHVIQQLGQ